MSAAPVPQHAVVGRRAGPISDSKPRQRRADRRSDLRNALHAERTKLRTTPAAAWLAAAALALTTGLGALAAAAARYHPGTGQDLAKTSLTGITLGQAVIAILAVSVISNEYGTGMIATTLTAMPHRGSMLAAKATILTAVVVPAGAAAVLASLLTGRQLLTGNGFTAAHGYPPLSLTDGPTLRAAAGSVLYLALIALLSLGIATAIRDAATATATVLALLYLFPILASAITNPTWQRHLHQISPMDAGLAIQNTTHLHGLPISPWAGLGVLAAWAVAGMLAATACLRLRDA